MCTVVGIVQVVNNSCSRPVLICGKKYEPTSMVKMKGVKNKQTNKKTNQDPWQVMQSQTRLKFHLIVSRERLMRALARACAGLHSQFESFMSYEGCAPVFPLFRALELPLPRLTTCWYSGGEYGNVHLRCDTAQERNWEAAIASGSTGSGRGVKNRCDKGQNEEAQKILVICGDWLRPRLKMGIWVGQWSFFRAN